MVTIGMAATEGSDAGDFSETVGRLVKSLSDAIQAGHLDKARHFVTELGKLKAKLDLVQIQEVPEMMVIDISIQRFGQDRGRIRIHLNRKITIQQLKLLIEEQHHIPVRSQRWMYNQQCPDNEFSLAQLGLQSGSVLGLYVMSDAFGCLPQMPYTPEMPEAYFPVQNEPLNFDDLDLNLDIDTPPPPLPGAMARIDLGLPAGQIRELHEVVPVAPAPVKAPVQWSCEACTLDNEPTRPSCAACGTDRPADFEFEPPADYQPSAEELKRLEAEQLMTSLFMQTQAEENQAHQQYVLQNLDLIAQADDNNLIHNLEEFECSICFTEVGAGEGVVLRNCVHEFCRDCLGETIKNSEGPDAKCPFAGDDYQCNDPIQDREIVALVSAEEFEKYQARSLRVAEGQAKNSFHCKSANCPGWCVYEDEVNFFPCPVCNKQNCLTCKAQHEGKNCQDYQDDLNRRAGIDTEIQATLQGIQAMLANGEAMNCNSCGVLLQKKEGCDWMRCSMCLTELCWATRGLRWGPKGNGDTSGGCKCGIGGRMCRPNCGNCH